MEDLNLLVARNLKRIRDEKKLSLDKLSELTGVSKSMLGQIERGDSSPTIATMWKISNGLKISFSNLIEIQQTDIQMVQRAEIQPLLADESRYRVYPFFPIESDRRFEVYVIEIEPGGSLNAEPHPDGTQEFVTVFQGELIMLVDEQEFLIKEGDGIRFRADRPHGYRNNGATCLKISMTILYL
ncbi:MAG: DNA-binding protein [Chloroflexi bacterium HGW-Chloroflexi-10]|nr:MAG: DNA-binding protein [Chloroflexi bacterium HGW-Chloroflexi-10]